MDIDHKWLDRPKIYHYETNSYLFITKLNVPFDARLRRISLSSIAIPSGYKDRLNNNWEQP